MYRPQAERYCKQHIITLVLCRPTTAYAPWFGVVLKTARLAVSTISILSEEVRSCCLLSDTMQCVAPNDQVWAICLQALHEPG